MKRLPLTLAIVHAIVATIAFALAMSPLHGDIFPVLLSIVEFPASTLASWLSELLKATPLIDAAIYVIIGSAWFYLIGMLVQRVIRKLKNYKKTTQPTKNERH
jgi:hypothetical protein